MDGLQKILLLSKTVMMSVMGSHHNGGSFFFIYSQVYMKIIIASDSYKGCMLSKDIGAAVSAAIAKLDPSADTLAVCVADGGEGTVEAMVDSFGGRIVRDIVSDPLGRPISAEYGIAGDLAIIESAAACGLSLLSPSERNPLNTSTRGLGELIVAAARRGCRRFIVGLGGSATNDGGIGMISAPGFLDYAMGKEFLVACDVDTPFVGLCGASRVFAPQKGASPEEVDILEKRMVSIAAKILNETGTDVSDMPGAGAAGGLGGAFHAYLGATLKPGVDIVLDSIRFDELLDDADLVITGEGCSDYQTVKGKTAFGILQRAKRRNVPVALVSGAVRDEEILRDAGFSHIVRVSPEGLPTEEAMRPEVTRVNLESAIKRLMSDE